MQPAISVIIPTRLDAPRSRALLRAIDSVRGQHLPGTRIILAVNGQRRDPALEAQLRECPDIAFVSLATPGVQAARLAGRDAVATPFFCFLDDDDEFLPDALNQRLAPMLGDAAIDAVVGRGYRIDAGRQTPSGRASRSTPLHELAQHNWLTSCGALYRSERIGRAFFSALPEHFEWTLLAFELCLSRRLCFIDHRGHLIHDTPGSLSKSNAYLGAQAQVIERVLKLPLPADTRGLLRRQYAAALHALAEHHHLTGARARAWRAHVSSLLQPGGARYIFFTRKLWPFGV